MTDEQETHLTELIDLQLKSNGVFTSDTAEGRVFIMTAEMLAKLLARAESHSKKLATILVKPPTPV